MKENFKFQIYNFKFTINLWLILICLFFLVTRLYQIDSNPPSLYWDEASIGYNAYSILKTGHDEWGTRTPIHFRAFGEFKLPLYIYSTVIIESIFGLTPLAIRLPAVLYSLGSLILVYLLVRKITQKELPGLLAAFAFSISPWMFIFSRTGYEATAGLFFFLLTINFFLLSQQKKVFILFSVISLIFSIYSYNSFRILSVFVIAILICQKIWVSCTKKSIVLYLGLLLIFLISWIPILRLYLFDNGLNRANALGFSTGDAFNNLITFSKNYFAHYSGNFLLLGDVNPRSQQPGFGQLYWLDLTFVVIGFLVLLKNRKYFFGLIIFLILIAPIPAALFKEAPHPLRAILLAPLVAILSGLGIWWVIEKKRLLIWPILTINLLFFGFYYFNFLTTYPVKTSADWQFGYQQIYTQYADKFSNYDNIIISDDYAQPYIFALAYMKIDPYSFQKTSVKNPVNDWGFSTISQFGKFFFVKANHPNLDHPGKSLVFMTKPLGNKLPDKQINFLNGQSALFVYTIDR